MRLSNDFRLLDLVNAIATGWGASRFLSLVQQGAVAAVVAASRVFCGLPVTESDSFFSFFLYHFIFLSN